MGTCGKRARTLQLIVGEVEVLELCELAQLRHQRTCRSIWLAGCKFCQVGELADFGRTCQVAIVGKVEGFEFGELAQLCWQRWPSPCARTAGSGGPPSKSSRAMRLLRVSTKSRSS